MRKILICCIVLIGLCLAVGSNYYIKHNSHKTNMESEIANGGNCDIINSWIGEYYYEEYCPPNMGMGYIMTVCQEEGGYAYIKIDGFQTLKRLKAKVWSRENEIMFEFYQYYTDENGNNTIYESYNEGDILFKMKKENGVLITEWCKLRPMIPENEKPGQYFNKRKEI